MRNPTLSIALLVSFFISGTVLAQDTITILSIQKDDHIQGEKSAPVVLIEYGDLECPFCARHHITMQKAKNEFGNDVAWVFRHFPLSFHKNAFNAATVSEAISDHDGNDAFWKFIDMVFQKGATEEVMIDIATSMGISKTTLEGYFEPESEDDKYRKNIEDEFALGKKLGVTGTPTTFIVNTHTGKYEIVSGAVPYESLVKSITKIMNSGKISGKKRKQVKCVFKEGRAEISKVQECYSADEHTSRFGCRSKSYDDHATCIVDVQGYDGEKITWKSSCGGYAYTKIDGENEYAEFYCGSSENSEKGFRNAYWICQDGFESKEMEGGPTSCKPSETWRKYAEEACVGRCDPRSGKCGVSKFSVQNECTYNGETRIRKVLPEPEIPQIKYPTPRIVDPVVVKTQYPPAGYEDKVLVNFDAYNNPFPDTSTSDLSGKAAAELYRRAVIGGYPDGEFKGYRDVNRAEAAKFLLLTRYGDVNEARNNGRFPDVLDGQWYTKYVVTAADNGVISGHPDGTFRPANTVNTAEFLKMLSLTFELQLNLPYSYADVSSQDWFAQYAGIAQKYDLFPGRSTYLKPGDPLTREEVAVAIYQYLQNR